jgi:toxin-antitoxin system PIN domain toxin
VAYLLDTGVLVALAWPNHVHHERASGWFAANRRHGWATCPITQSGFVRVSSNAAVVPAARTPRECLLLLREIVALPHHEFWNDDTSLATSKYLAEERLVGYRQVTDAHLLALALRRRGCLATLDRGVRQLVPGRFDAGRVVECLIS